MVLPVFLPAAQVQDKMLFSGLAHQFLQTVRMKSPVPEHIGCDDHMACAGLQIFRGVFRSDPPADLQAARDAIKQSFAIQEVLPQ